MFEKKNTSSFLSSLPIFNNKIFNDITTVRVLIPNLDLAFEPLDQNLVIPALEATLNILMFRHTPKLEYLDLLLFNSDDFVDRGDEYEDYITENFISEAIAFEQECGGLNSELDVETREHYYSILIQNILEHYDYYFINGGYDENIEQLEFLIDYYDKHNSIKLQNYKYDLESQRLFLFICN